MTDNRPTIIRESINIAGREMIFETGRLAQLADGAVTVQYGETLVLSTAQGDPEPREGMDFFPLTIDYEERMYAAGKIPGGFIKREGRPSEHAILSARLTDRPIRPLFPSGYRCPVQVITTVFSTDQQNDPDILSINGASAALTISAVPFQGPIGAVRIGLVNDTFVVNPTQAELAESRMDLVVAGTRDAIMMVEGESKEVSEGQLVDAIALAHEQIALLVDVQLRLQEQVGKPKREANVPGKDQAVADALRAFVGERLEQAVFNPDKSMRQQVTADLKREAKTHFASRAAESGADAAAASKTYSNAFEDLVKATVRSAIIERGDRPDGRAPNEIRPIWCEVGYLPRTHGSAIFTRGQTQAVTVATLGSTKEDQMLDGLGLETSKRYMHHYNFPPYSVGEVRQMRGAGRREIGHGALAERALQAVLPSQADFPYVLRVVSEVVSSNGSTSMASVCGSTLALMDAGVPITSPVAGVAMGLITDEAGRYAILSDIQGLEDALGDMDFKVAGTSEGVTAIQMDIKVKGITTDIMRQALEQARHGRLHILAKMLETISVPRGTRSSYAPSIVSIKIDPSQIGSVIGPGGKIIRAIQEASGTKIDIEDDGMIYVSGVGGEATGLAIEEIKKITYVPSVGDRLRGPVKTIIQVGAFVEIAPGKDAFVHVSQLSTERVERVEDAVSVGDVIDVVITDVRSDGKIDASRRAAITGEMPPPRAPRPDRGPGGPPRRDGDRGPRREGGGRRFDGTETAPPPREEVSDGRPRDARRPGFARREE
ncbi:MAG TPA: polyribonucleotide nucleotidyltransferase [Thermomicrobiales bacterium]|nr:polyribonucleotide nucleotidyltransferase [Thermomicrobiales bacterium]